LLGSAVVSGLGWGVFARGFGGVGLLFGCILGIGCVLRRGVNGIKYQRLVAGVSEVVPSSGGHSTLVARFNRVCFPAQVPFAGAGNEGVDLVGVFVDFITNLAAHRVGHDHDLGVFTGPQGPAEIRTFFGDVGARDVFDVAVVFELFFVLVLLLLSSSWPARSWRSGCLGHWPLGCGRSWSWRLSVGRCASGAWR